MTTKHSLDQSRPRRKVLFWPRKLQPTVTTIFVDSDILVETFHETAQLHPTNANEHTLKHAISCLSVSAPATIKSALQSVSSLAPSSLPAATYNASIFGNAWHHGKDYVFYWLGGPETLMQRADLTQNEREALLQQARQLSLKGRQVYVVATCTMNNIKSSDVSSVKPRDLTLLGFVSFPVVLQSGVVEALNFCKEHAINVIYASRDNELLVTAIAHKSALLSSHELPFRYIAGIPLQPSKVYASLDTTARNRVIAQFDPETTIVAAEPLSKIVRTISVQ